MKFDSYVAGFLIVAASALLSIGGLLAARRLLRSRDLLDCHDVGGYLLSVVGTLYAVILGLIVVDSMSTFQQARMTTEQESNALADLILLSNQLPAREREEVRGLALEYIERVIADEWPALEEGHAAPRAHDAAIRLVDAVSNFEPASEKEKAIYASELEAVCQFWDNRRTRIVTATHGLPTLEWVVLIAGAAITVSFTYFFKLEHLKVQVIMTAMVATTIALSLFLVLSFGYPFSGDITVSSESFRAAQAIIEHPAVRAPTGP